ncbi:MAG: sulfite exporter TauE/SafE family protein [Rhodovarius sp.]|nr:sulfite exporter TauE/SafE family protein [Rhodovarius sp.]
MIALPLTQALAGGASGSLVGFTLGLVGGGGSILAVPLLIHGVGVASPHVAIGTAAVAVALNAAFGAWAQARAGLVRWPCASVFAGAGVIGAFAGAQAAKAVDGQMLLALFSLLMMAVAVLMFRRQEPAQAPTPRLSRDNAPALLAAGLGVGLLAGFFGIGGGFLVVPGLLWATGMPLPMAVGSSLVAVAAFGLTTAASYAWAGLIDWPLALVFVAGGALGSLFGARLGRRLAARRRALGRLLAAVIMLVGAYTFVLALMRLA